MSLRDKILHLDDTRRVVQHVAEWDCDVQVRSMSARTRMRLLEHLKQDPDDVGLQVLVLVATCYDPETGNRLFEESDAAWLVEKHAGVIQQLANAGLRISGMMSGSVDEGKGG